MLFSVCLPILVGSIILLARGVSAARLQVSGRELNYNGEKVFLNGVNIAWIDYGNDFGNGAYTGELEDDLREISEAGGNSIRVWLHVEGYYTPIFDSNGYVTSCDTTGTFTSDIVKLLNSAKNNNILVTLVLWNGASLTNQYAIDLVWDDSKLDSYIDNCLTEFVLAVAGHPALAAWETVNEPEGSVRIESNAETCYDTTLIGDAGAGWNGVSIPMQKYLRFIGRQNMVIRRFDPTGLITLGSWGQFAQNSAFANSHNHYTDYCLNLAAGGTTAGLDFYQMHTYDWEGAWSLNAPFTVSAADYQLDKPLLLGEYASLCAAGTSLRDLYEYTYTHGYVGGFSWQWHHSNECNDAQNTQRDALEQLSTRAENGRVDIVVY